MKNDLFILNRLIEKIKLNWGIEIILFIIGVAIIIYSIIFFPILHSKGNPLNPLIHLTYFIAFMFMFMIGTMFVFMGFQILYYKNFLGKLELERIIRLLNNDEKLVLEIIERNGGEILQSKIADITMFSLAKVSRIVNNLRKMGIVVCNREGKNKKVKLSSRYIKFK